MSDGKALDNRQVIEKALIVLIGFVASGLWGCSESPLSAPNSAPAPLSIPSPPPSNCRRLSLSWSRVGRSVLPSSQYTPLGDSRTQAAAWRLASAVMSLSAAAAALLGIVVYLFAPQLVNLVLFSNRPPEQQQLVTDMVRLMMLTPVIFSISGLVMAILHSHAAFWLPAIAISMNNIGIIIGALIIAPALPAHPDVGQVGDLNVIGLAYGAVLSAVLHLLVQIPGLFKLRARLRPLLSLSIPGVADVLRLMGPRVLGLAVVQVNFHVNIILANTMVDGSVSAIRYAFMLSFFALGMIGQSTASAVFPTLAALRAKGDYDGFKDRLSHAMRNVLYLSFPASAVLIVLGEPLVSILQRGQWNAESTQAVAWALGFYAIGLAGFALLEVLSRAFYALEDTRTPVIAGIGAMVSNIILNLIFIQIIGDPTSLARGAFAGLALANALTTIVEALVLWWLIRRSLAEHRHNSRYSRSCHFDQRRRQLAALARHGRRPPASDAGAARWGIDLGAQRLHPGCLDLLRRRLSLRPQRDTRLVPSARATPAASAFFLE